MFSPLGDVTTLMVWQKEKLKFTDFVGLVVPGVVNWLINIGLLLGLSIQHLIPPRAFRRLLLRPQGSTTKE